MNSKSGPFDVIGQLAALRRYALSLVRNADEAEDLVNDALVRAYEHQSSFRRGGNIRQWLFSILHNTHVDSLRRRRSAARRDAQAADLVDPVVGAEQEHVVRLAQVRRAFLDLPEEQRQALHLVAIEELSYQEAAEVLDIPMGTLMSRLSRARARLRDLEMTDAGRRALPAPVEKSAHRGQGSQKQTGLRIVGGSDDTPS
ncbi:MULTISPECIES: sigma-70 family RNA polymerase sigma factor [Rhizobium/Agrobacterium group]|uniref:sigma-70 family RNA polymerase sigma factor n=1 Tax=Rhizobium/Agrobacterium group TaxID=227290 RepID=UPI000B3F77D8|nr:MULTISPECIES: sigma-70 family RNA polymerase sigma factor [Rhizobium/Agrobacterium group]NSZ44480.1 sigma-70 family RNA polymerase sigma factor [Agrobacterium vitis]NTA28227.1 sigma-70 family RNA polymerase sigma factor [Allorhizobium ampelinum]OVE92872.1 RNA polymerase subunit sigma [Allorhizobium ampelinum]